MKYISGIHALNIPCSLATSGDWHYPSLAWDSRVLRDTAESPFGDYGIERHSDSYESTNCNMVANHIRACLDMLVEADYANLQGMRSDYICTDSYDDEIFGKVWQLRALPDWQAIDRFMEKEYLLKWVNFRERSDTIDRNTAAT